MWWNNFFQIFIAINAIEILKNKVFVLTHHFTTRQER